MVQRSLRGGAIGQKRTGHLRIRLRLRCTHHVGDGEVFEHDKAVVVHESATQLVGGVATLMSDPSMKSRHHFNLAATPVRTTLLG
jgi:hypothetical protein